MLPVTSVMGDKTVSVRAGQLSAFSGRERNVIAGTGMSGLTVNTSSSARRKKAHASYTNTLITHYTPRVPVTARKT